jgi:uncharacterized RDD family membrane protein YckC
VNQPQDAPSGHDPGEGQTGQPGPDQPGPGYGTPTWPADQTQPGYGAQPGSGGIPGYPQAGPYQQGQPGYSQPGYGQPGYGQPRHGQYSGYGTTSAQDPALAEWWRRLFARIIDWLILGIVFSPLWIPPWSTFLTAFRKISNSYPPGTQLTTIPAARTAIANAESHLFGRLFVVALLFYLVAFGYDWLQHAVWGQTIGKRALGTVVVSANTGEKVSTGAASGRAAIYALTPIVPLVGSLFDLLNELWLVWDRRRQCLHDKAAHTVVIKKEFVRSRPQAGGW